MPAPTAGEENTARPTRPPSSRARSWAVVLTFIQEAEPCVYLRENLPRLKRLLF